MHIFVRRPVAIRRAFLPAGPRANRTLNHIAAVLSAAYPVWGAVGPARGEFAKNKIMRNRSISYLLRLAGRSLRTLICLPGLAVLIVSFCVAFPFWGYDQLRQMLRRQQDTP